MDLSLPSSLLPSSLLSQLVIGDGGRMKGGKRLGTESLLHSGKELG